MTDLSPLFSTQKSDDSFEKILLKVSNEDEEEREEVVVTGTNNRSQEALFRPEWLSTHALSTGLTPLYASSVCTLTMYTCTYAVCVRKGHDVVAFQ